MCYIPLNFGQNREKIARNSEAKLWSEWILQKTDIKPKIGIVCGSGLGGLGDRLEKPTIIPYSQIPCFPNSTGIFHSFIFIKNWFI